jgi:hypothetical protein
MGIQLPAECQDMIIAKVIPLIGWGNSDMGGAGYGGALQGQLDNFGLKVDYTQSYTAQTDEKRYYKSFNLYGITARWRFAHKDNDIEIGHMLNAGFHHTMSYKHQVFQAVDPTLRPPDYNPDETQRLLSTYYTNLRITSNFMSIGYERLKKHDFKYAGWFTHRILNPFGLVVGSFDSYDEGEMFYSSSLYIEMLLLAPGGCTYEAKGYYNLYGGKPATNNLILETLYKNSVGLKMGYEVSTLNSFGLTAGLEMGIIPGIFHQSSDYGNGFPQDNMYFSAKVGIALGYSAKD